VTIVTSDRKPAWRAELTCETRTVPIAKETAADEQEQETATGQEQKIVEGQKEETADGQEEEVDLVRVRNDFVDIFHPNGGWVRFRVNRRKDRRLSFTDYREQQTGAAGTTGIWGTLPPQPAGKPRSLTPAGFRLELAALVGAERADEIVNSLMP